MLTGEDAWAELEEYELEYHLEQFDHPMRYTVALSRFLQDRTRIADGTPWSVLDSGTGAGGALRWLARDLPACSFVGIDTNAQLVELGRERLAADPSIVIRRQDALLPLGDSEFDFCISQQVVSWLAYEEAEVFLSHQMAAARVAVAAAGLFTQRNADYAIEVRDRDAGKMKPVTILGLTTVGSWAQERGFAVAAYEPFEMDYDLPDQGRPRDIRTMRCGDRNLAFAGDVYMPWGMLLLQREAR